MFSKINESNIYLTSEIKKECKCFTIHTTSQEYQNELQQKISELLKIDLSQLVPRRPRDKDVLKNMEWFSMPTYEMEKAILKTFIFRIYYTENEEHIINDILKVMNNPKVSNKSAWYPQRLKELYSLQGKVVVETEKITPKYPIYIISKGRYKTGTTAKYLDRCSIDYRIVIEPDEYDLYIANCYDPDKIIVCPENFSKREKGGIPVRNFVWEHSIAAGAEKHWILDDNISHYFRIHKSQKNIIYSGAVFKQVEDYADRYKNIKMCGHNYSFFVACSQNPYPIIKNTRIYSSILLSNDIYPEYAWRGRYNEDTDLSLRLLKAGYPTLLFNNICANKATTMRTKGGNTDTIYAVEDAHLKKSQELADNFPDIVQVVIKYDRYHHEVNYKGFKKLKPIWKEGVKETLIDKNEYGLRYV